MLAAARNCEIEHLRAAVLLREAPRFQVLHKVNIDALQQIPSSVIIAIV